MGAGAGGSNRQQRENPLARRLRNDRSLFPRVKSPITSDRFSAQNGMLWVRRETTVGDENVTVDVISQERGLVGRVVLPARSTIVGFGRDTVYVVRIDEDDLQWLERHALPRW